MAGADPVETLEVVFYVPLVVKIIGTRINGMEIVEADIPGSILGRPDDVLSVAAHKDSLAAFLYQIKGMIFVAKLAKLAKFKKLSKNSKFSQI